MIPLKQASKLVQESLLLQDYLAQANCQQILVIMSDIARKVMYIYRTQRSKFLIPEVSNMYLLPIISMHYLDSKIL